MDRGQCGRDRETRARFRNLVWMAGDRGEGNGVAGVDGDERLERRVENPQCTVSGPASRRWVAMRSCSRACTAARRVTRRLNSACWRAGIRSRVPVAWQAFPRYRDPLHREIGRCATTAPHVVLLPDRACAGHSRDRRPADNCSAGRATTTPPKPYGAIPLTLPRPLADAGLEAFRRNLPRSSNDAPRPI